MKGLICLVAMLVASAANACNTVSVQCVQPQVAVVQSLGVPVVQSYAVPQVAVQSFAVVPQAVQVQTFAVQAFATPVVVQNVHVRQVRQPRQVVRTRSVVRSR